MATVQNEVDAILQAATVRSVAPDSARVIVQPSAPLFHVSSGGVSDPLSITFKAALVDVAGDIEWTCNFGTLVVSGDDASMTYASLGAATSTIVTATVKDGVNVMAVGSYMIGVIKDVNGAKLVSLDASELVFKIDKANSNSPASITLTATGQNTAGTPSFTIPVGTATLTAGANSSQKILTFANMSTDTATIEVTLDGQKDRVTITKLREGADGSAGVAAILTNEAVLVPSNSAGAVSSFADAVCTEKVYVGTTDDSANWNYGFSPSSASNRLTYTTNAGTVTITGMAAGVDSSYVDITATHKTSGVTLLPKRFSVAKSKQGASVTGARGNVDLTGTTTGTAWSATDALNTIANQGFGAPAPYDIVTLVNSAAGFIETRVYISNAWSTFDKVLNGKVLFPGSVLANAIDTRGLSIKDDNGNVIFSAGLTLAEQTMTNRNLVPSFSSWICETPNNAGWHPDSATGYAKDGMHLIMLKAATHGTGLRMFRSPNIQLEANTRYTLSFNVNADAQTDIIIDLIPDTLNETGLTIPANQGSGGATRRVIAWITPNLPADVANCYMRIFAYSPPGQVLLWDLKLEKGQRATPWCDSVTTTTNVAQHVLPNSITNTQIGGNLQSTNWNGVIGPGGQGWMLDRAGNMYMNSATVRGTVKGSLIESSAFKMDSARLLSVYDRLCAFSIYDSNTQLWTSGQGYCEIILANFVGPLSAVPWSYNPKRFSDFSKDVYLKVTVTGNAYVQVIIGAQYHNDGNWRWIVSPGVDLTGNGSRTFTVRYTTSGEVWNDLKFAAWTQSGTASSLCFEMQMSNFNDAVYASQSNSGIASSSPPPPPPPPPEDEPPPQCVDYETTVLSTGRFVRDLCINDLVEVWNDDPTSPAVEYEPVQLIGFGAEQSYLLRSRSGAEIIQSQSTPMTLRDGRVVTTALMLGEDVLVQRKGELMWEPVVEIEDRGIRKVVKVSLGDRMYFAGMDSRATIATHNIQYKP